MKAEEHPHFQEEQQRLQDTIECLDAYLQKHKVVLGRGADDGSAYAVADVQGRLVREARYARKDLYFRRLDLQNGDSGESEQFYVGKTPFLDPGTGRVMIVSWQNPTFGKLVYGRERECKLGRLVLNRSFDINDDQLMTIVDNYIASDYEIPGRDGMLVAEGYADALLSDLLARSRGSELGDIVRTIQAQQYEIITAPYDSLLIVHGPPGSGKTEVALHRVSYLLYQAREQGRREQNILILGPNRLFLQYAAGVLPSLGEAHIPQRTFDEWALGVLGTDIDYELQHESLEFLLEPAASRSQKVIRYRNDRNKGSLTMATLLKRYVEHLYSEAVEDKGGFYCQLYIPSVTLHVGGNRLTHRSPHEIRISLDLVTSETIPEQDLEPALKAASNSPLNERRDVVEKTFQRHVESRLKQSLLQEATEKGLRQLEESFHEIEREFERSPRSNKPPLTEEEKGHARRELRTMIYDRVQSQAPDVIVDQVHERFENWRQQNVSVAYRRLLRTPSLLYRLGEGLFSTWELESLHQDAPRAGIPFRFSDLGALQYLRLLLDGPGDVIYDHIVVDEAQDLTPLQWKVLSDYSHNSSMTVLGDLGQGIYAHHGVGQWDELHEAVGTDNMQLASIETSYRSTQEIIEYANRVLSRAGTPSEQLIRPFARQGEPTRFHPLPSSEAQLEKVVHLVRKNRNDGWNTIAIVCRTADDCRKLSDELKRIGFDDFQIVIDPGVDYEGGVVVLPAYLTKGLEFDVVILADGNAKTYPADEMHLRLLYVAITRAAHVLHVCHEGELAPLLDDNRQRVVMKEPVTGDLSPHPITISDYAEARQEVDADWCVERLAGADRLRLLKSGRIDATILDVFLEPYLDARIKPMGEGDISPLSDELKETLRQHLTWVLEFEAAVSDRELAFVQMAYGLVRNHLRILRLGVPETEETDLNKQVVAMTAFLRAFRQRDLMLGAGRWTTVNRVLEMVSAGRTSAASRNLELLLAYGLIERSGPRIRMRVDWIPGLVELALGHTPADWDHDLLDQLDYLSPSSGLYEYVEERAYG